MKDNLQTTEIIKGITIGYLRDVAPAFAESENDGSEAVLYKKAAKSFIISFFGVIHCNLIKRYFINALELVVYEIVKRADTPLQKDVISVLNLAARQIGAATKSQFIVKFFEDIVQNATSKVQSSSVEQVVESSVGTLRKR